MAGRVKKRVYAHSVPVVTEIRPVPPLESTPAAPKYLGPIGREYWEQITPVLVEARMLSTLDLQPLSALCDWWEVYRTQVEYLRKHPGDEFSLDDKGHCKKGPAAVMRDTAYAQCLRLWPKFGFSPESHRKLKKISKQAGGGPEVAGADGLAEFAAGKYE